MHPGSARCICRRPFCAALSAERDAAGLAPPPQRPPPESLRLAQSAPLLDTAARFCWMMGTWLGAARDSANTYTPSARGCGDGGAGAGCGRGGGAQVRRAAGLLAPDLLVEAAAHHRAFQQRRCAGTKAGRSWAASGLGRQRGRAGGGRRGSPTLLGTTWTSVGHQALPSSAETSLVLGEGSGEGLVSGVPTFMLQGGGGGACRRLRVQPRLGSAA